MRVALERFGRLDHALGNAGVTLPKLIDDTTDEELELLWRVNVKGLVHLAQAAHAPLTESRGSLTVLASKTGLVAQRNSPFYVATKGAAMQLARALALDWAPEGIRVNAVCPGIPRRPSASTSSRSRSAGSARRRRSRRSPSSSPRTPPRSSPASRCRSTAASRPSDRRLPRPPLGPRAVGLPLDERRVRADRALVRTGRARGRAARLQRRPCDPRPGRQLARRHGADARARGGARLDRRRRRLDRSRAARRARARRPRRRARPRALDARAALAARARGARVAARTGRAQGRVRAPGLLPRLPEARARARRGRTV